MGPVEQAIGRSAAPQELELRAGVKRLGGYSDRSNGLVADPAPFDLRHRLLTDAGPFCQFDLAPAQPSSQLSHEVTEAPIISADVATGLIGTYVTRGPE